MYLKGMKEYTLIRDENNPERYFLLPTGDLSPRYALAFDSKEMAHEYRLALGLGTYPTYAMAPENYDISSFKYEDVPTYKIVKPRENAQDLVAPNCCKSGCDGCPWTLEQIRLGNL